MSHADHWKYMATRNFYGRSRLYSVAKALRMFALWFFYRNSQATMLVECRKCGDEYRALKRLIYYYDNTKCGRCYL